MKTLIFSLVIFCAMVSCREEETHCFACKAATNGQVTEFTRCDITQREADQIARAGTVIDPESGHPFGVHMETYTVCTKAD